VEGKTMHRTFSKVGIAGAAFVVVLGLTMVIRGDVALKQRTGFPQDWSHSHLIFANPGSFAQAVRNGSVAHWYRIMNDPRYQMQQLRRSAAALQRNVAALKPTPPKPAPPKSAPVAKDWNFSLQTAAADSGVAQLRYPAKYSFNETGANCTNDYVVYGLLVAGSSTQANLVGVNNLYVGAAGGGGCGSITNNGGAGTAPSPEVKWAFNVAANAIRTSVVLSLDGTKVAYVVDTNPATLQVLTLGSGTVGNTCGAAVCSVGNPATPGNSTEAPGSALTSVTLTNGVGDNLSAPYVDYGDDIAYVGDNGGHLFKITGVFKGTPTLAGGTYWATAGSSTLGSPVYDGATGTVFVGASNGKLYGFNASTGSAITGSGLTLDSGAYGIYLAPPIVDSTNHLLYEFYGDNPNGTAGVAQVVFTSSPQFSSSTTSSLSTAGTNLTALATTSANTFFITDGAFSESYFSGFSTSTSFLYVCGANATGTSGTVGASLQQFAFNAGPILSGAVPSKVVILDTSTTVANAGNGGICSGVTEFYNTNTNTDHLFLSNSGATSPLMIGVNITNNSSNGGASPPYGIPTAMSVGLAGGSSGIVVDGADPTSNASSLYFTSHESATCTDTTTASPSNTGIGSNASAICAFKLTQSGLQ
jgi:hypothetical protein